MPRATKVDVWMPLYISDYDRATSRLTLAEDAADMRLIRDYWTNGAPPNDNARLALIIRIDVREWKKLRPAVEPFFEIKGGRWTHDRVEKELAKADLGATWRRKTGAEVVARESQR